MYGILYMFHCLYLFFFYVYVAQQLQCNTVLLFFFFFFGNRFPEHLPLQVILDQWIRYHYLGK